MDPEGKALLVTVGGYAILGYVVVRAGNAIVLGYRIKRANEAFCEHLKCLAHEKMVDLLDFSALPSDPKLTKAIRCRYWIECEGANLLKESHELIKAAYSVPGTNAGGLPGVDTAGLITTAVLEAVDKVQNAGDLFLGVNKVVHDEEKVVIHYQYANVAGGTLYPYCAGFAPSKQHED